MMITTDHHWSPLDHNIIPKKTAIYIAHGSGNMAHSTMALPSSEDFAKMCRLSERLHKRSKGQTSIVLYFFQVQKISFTSSLSSKSGIEKVCCINITYFPKDCLKRHMFEEITHFRWGEERSPSGFGHRCPCATPWNKPVTWPFIARIIFVFFVFLILVCSMLDLQKGFSSKMVRSLGES